MHNQPVATLSVGNTGGMQSWQTRSTSVSTVTGLHDVYLRATGPVNLNWNMFNR